MFLFGAVPFLMPWPCLFCFIQKGSCSKIFPFETMLRIHLLAELYNLADMAVMNEVIDSRAFLEFWGIDSSNQVPDGEASGGSALYC